MRELDETGRLWLRSLLSERDTIDLARHCDVGDKAGVRLELHQELTRYVGQRSELSRRVVPLGVHPSPVRLVAFNKTAQSNWSVPWHQDRVIAVSERRDIPGYAKWIAKDGFWHVEPPIELLRDMLFARVHFDASDERNGALEIAVGSHQQGIVRADHAERLAAISDVEICRAEPGDVLVVKALALHRSRSSEVGGERRALRIDYAKRADLATGLQWALPAEGDAVAGRE